MKKPTKKEIEETPILKYLGTYRIYAKYDIGTNDFIRNKDGTIDQTFDDYYMLTKTKDEIHHAYDNVYVLYVWSIKRGNKILSQLYDIDCDAILECEQTDCETIIMFEEEYMEIIDQCVSISTYGASISPIDISNLPKESFGIPEVEQDKLSQVCQEYDIKKTEMRGIYANFISSKDNKKNNALEYLKNSKIPPKVFIYKNGWWNELLKYIIEYDKIRQDNVDILDI